MPTLPECFYDCRGFEQRRAWLQRENKARCEAATARRKADPAATLDDLEFTTVPAEAPAVELEWDLDPSRVGR